MSVEFHLESKILSGVRPEQALADLITSYDPKFKARWERVKRTYGNKPTDFAITFGINNVFKQLQIPIDFLYKWYLYPSGRTRTQMLFANNAPVLDPSNKLILFSDSIIWTRPSGAIINNVRMMLPCLSLISDPLYIPVLRYQARSNVGLFFKSEYDPQQHCGTYYFFDPGPGIYLRSGKTLVAPDPIFAYFYLLGGNELALNTLIEEMLPGISDRSMIEVYKDWLRNNMNNCLTGRELQEMEESLDIFTAQNSESVEQQLCFLSRQLGIDIVLLTYPMIWKQNKSEVIDTRNRLDSYSSLYRLNH